MASSLIARAKQELVKQRDKAKALRDRHKAETDAALSGASVLVGAAAAGLLDQKFGEGGAPAEVRGIPTSALVGGAAVGAAALVKGMPFRAPLAAVGLGMASTALYNLVRENVQFDG
jgi:hypothetical protein